MTYFELLDRLSLADRLDAIEREVAKWDDLCPWWEESQQHPEQRRFVPENDVLDPDATIIWGWGGDHRAVLSFGRNDPCAWN